jgi:hypothetical protein
LKEGWQITGVEAWHTGVLFSLGEGTQPYLNNNFDTPRPNVVGGCDVYANQNVHQWFNPACFTASTYGRIYNGEASECQYQDDNGLTGVDTDR